jgi:signal transduction histidine kinase
MAVGLVVFAAALLWGTSRVLFEQLDQAIAASAFLAAERLVHPAPQGTLDAMVADEPSRYAREVNRYIVLRQVDGSVAGAQPRRAATLPLDTAAFRAAQAGRQVWLTQAWSGRAVRVTYVAVSEQGVRGERVIQAAASLDPIHAVRRDLFFALAAVVLVGTAATFLGAWALAGSAVRPVSEIIEQATRIEPGGPEPRIVAHAETEEYRGLVAVLNGMLERLDRAFRAQRRLTADVSHELRTPLTTVRMAGDVLHDARQDFDPVTARAAELLQTELDRFEGLLSDLLEISRFDAGAAVLDVDDVNLVDIAHRVVDMTRPLAAQRGTSVRVEALSDPCLAEADSRRVERVVRNLVTNAIDHAESGGIVVLVDGDDHASAVAVRDYGVGLAPGEAAMVFNRFWRSDPARARTSGGTGLGLSISLEDTHLHGGWLQAWGQPGRGSQFRLTLPRRAGGPLRHSPLPLVPADADQGQGAPA